jgi:UDP-2-acetamido-2-deoxy-ribo-hexuluronate aminotransferase
MQFCNLKQQYQELKPEIDNAIAQVLEHGMYIGGPEVAELEKKCTDFTGSSYAKACSSGTDALVLALMAYEVGHGDYVITTPFTFIATAECIALVGAKPLFVDIDPKTYNICPQKLKELLETTDVPLEKIKGVIPVDLYGQCADYDAIREVIKDYNLFIVQDAAQSFGAEYKGVKAGSHGDIGTTSFFPAKPFGCYGDGGMVFTSDAGLDEKLNWLRNHGQNERYKHKIIGINGRLDSMQCAVLNAKFDRFVNLEIRKRNNTANKYMELLKPLADAGKIVLPYVMPDTVHVWAQFTLQAVERDKLMKYMQDNQVPCAVHYPMPLHLQEAFADLGYKKGDFPISEEMSEKVVSLPMCAYKTDAEIEEVCDVISSFYRKMG